MASSQQVASINQATPDGGLKQVFETAKLNPEVVKILVEEEEVTNLAEFSSFFTKDGYEEEAVTLRNRVEALKNKQVEVARIRTAVLLARGVLAQPAPAEASPTKTPTVDMEAPLDPGAKETMMESWNERYGVQLTMHLDPADTLVSRLYREFRQNTPTLIPAGRMKSVYCDHNPAPEKKVALAGGLSLTVTGQEQRESIRDVAGYYFALRILANASAKAGNYMVESKVDKGVKVIFAPLDVNLDYADHALRTALKNATSQYGTLKWLEERDLHTRGLMCNYMRAGHSQGEALTLALREDEVKWATFVSPHSPADGSASGQKRQNQGGRGNDQPPHKKQKLGKMAQGQAAATSKYATLAKGGKKICRSYNMGQCHGKTCPYGGEHVCSVIENGRTCLGNHPAKSHRYGQR
jgi:hypothetical protein